MTRTAGVMTGKTAVQAWTVQVTVSQTIRPVALAGAGPVLVSISEG
jgi:hypothetical protein